MQHSNEVVEEWRTIEGFENYEVSNFERVRKVEMKSKLITLLSILNGVLNSTTIVGEQDWIE